jgi:hypothetical protein
VTEDVRKKKSKRRDALLTHCVARAVIAEQGGLEAATERYGAKAERLSKWAALRAGVRVTPKAARVAGFIITWAVAMREEGRESYSITEYQRFWNEGERQAYRLQADFRELWPEFETPDVLAAQLVRQLDARAAAKQAASLAMKLQVTA